LVSFTSPKPAGNTGRVPTTGTRGSSTAGLSLHFDQGVRQPNPGLPGASSQRQATASNSQELTGRKAGLALDAAREPDFPEIIAADEMGCGSLAD
jgi:hypothetical protein